jgi:two-component system sensor histidine kinase BaeS
MRSLFWKGMLAFLVVILVAVGTVALLSGRATEVEFRRYASFGVRWERQAIDLTGYYVEHNSWEGIQNTLHSLQSQGPGLQGRGRGSGGGGMGLLSGDFQLTDSEGRIVGDTAGTPSGTIPQAELMTGIPIQVEDRVVGYLFPFHQSNVQTPIALDVEQTQFLERVQQALWIAALAAIVAALVIGGLLFRSIVAPLRRLTAASQAIAEGDLTVRAPVQGQDEVAQLANAFNQMAGSLARAEEARRNQTADVAHELRTPLTILQGAIEAMLDGVYPTDRENLLAILTQAQTLTRLVEDLRLLALADAGQLELHASPLDLETFLSETVKAHRLQAQEQAVTLTLETPPTPPLVEADRDRLAQIVGNLLRNALQHIQQGGRITVRAAHRGHEIAVSVTDDGPGIPPEDLPHLFERFWRGGQARRRATGGSGLGLAITRSLVEAHGGHIWAESVEGEGSAFTFTLPVAPNHRS